MGKRNIISIFAVFLMFFSVTAALHANDRPTLELSTPVRITLSGSDDEVFCNLNTPDDVVLTMKCVEKNLDKPFRVEASYSLKNGSDTGGYDAYVTETKDEGYDDDFTPSELVDLKFTLQGTEEKLDENDRVTIEVNLLPSLSAAEVTLSKNSFTYTGKSIKPKVTVKYNGTVLTEDTDYNVYYNGNVDAGVSSIEIIGIGNYAGEADAYFRITKAANPLKVTPRNAAVSFKKLKKKNQTLAAKQIATVSKKVGNVTFKRVSGSKKISISKTGKVTLKKKMKKGTYKVTAKVTASGDWNYKAGSKNITFKIKVK